MTLGFTDVNFDVSKGVTNDGNDANFLPSGTVIKVELDSSGDFTSLSDAVNYLTGKWSNGAVTIRLGSGTFIEPATILLDNQNFNIPNLIINGNGASGTSIDSVGIADAYYVIKVLNGVNLEINNLLIKNSNGSSATGYRGIEINAGCNVSFTDVSCQGINRLATVFGNAICSLVGNISISEARLGLIADGGRIVLGKGTLDTTCTLVIQDSISGIQVRYGGIINGASGVTYTATNTTNKILPSGIVIGTPQNDGWITGISLSN